MDLGRHPSGLADRHVVAVQGDLALYRPFNGEILVDRLLGWMAEMVEGNPNGRATKRAAP